MTTYRVEVDGITVWEDVQDSYLGHHHFPEEHRGRPATGTVALFVDDECISFAVPEGVPE
jgi:hypothetical protein